MLCKCCREDLPKEAYSTQEYQACVRCPRIGHCSRCLALPKAEKRARAAAWLAGHPLTPKRLSKKDRRRAAKADRGTKQPAKAPSLKRQERDEIWRSLTHEQKRESLIKGRTHSEKVVEAALIMSRIPFDIQVPVGPYFVDFHIQPGKLAVEIDGGYHFESEQVDRDANRTIALQRHGWAVLRFTNERVKKDVEGVIKDIQKALRPKRKTKEPPKIVVVTNVEAADGDVSFNPAEWQQEAPEQREAWLDAIARDK